MISHTDAARDAAIDALFAELRKRCTDICSHNVCKAWRAWNAPAPQEDVPLQQTDNPHKSISNSAAIRFCSYCGTELTLMMTGPFYGCPGGVSTLRCLKCEPLPGPAVTHPHGIVAGLSEYEQRALDYEEPAAPHPQAEERCSQCGESERDGFHDEDPEQAAVDIACCPQGTLEDMMRIHRFVPAAETNEGVEGDGQRSTDEIVKDVRDHSRNIADYSDGRDGVSDVLDEAADRLAQLHREKTAIHEAYTIQRKGWERAEVENAALRKTLIDVKHELRETSSWPYLTIDLRERVTAALADGEKT